MKTFPLPLIAAFAFCGCETTSPTFTGQLSDAAQRATYGYVYYLDGAGGGTAKKNWAGGVKEGIRAGGFPGAGEMFTWETGKGLMADQTEAVSKKRASAARLAREIQIFQQEYPGAPVNLLSFSAGAAVAVFALEALPESVKVDRVIMLGASISDDYDLTQALKRVRDVMIVYTSTHDKMLGDLMKFSGTADRTDAPGAGIHGFVLPPGATAETQALYRAKIRTTPWTEQMKADGDHGKHFDNVKPEFVRDYVAPYLTRRQPVAAGAAVGSP